ncbi:hypothetical protein K2173_006013 [Erythroxylum novogranatense]|uniref:Uncharacterized protein n=1 Tax=Erythroxylum novogranatense TaxID=1862640 RepID=A0AAV8TDF6_9ROSI|nr:hypothetical protein K2173_006013 [Erythroxylum novogranatense]
MMGGQSSKMRGDTTSSAPQINTNVHIVADWSSYEVACKNDPVLQDFDKTLHERTTRVISSLATGVEVRSLSMDSLKEVTSCLLEMNQEVVQVILKSQEDIYKNQELFPLIEEYLENSIKTMDFCTALTNCLKRARNSQTIIKVALKQYELEMELQEGVAEKRHVKTLEELQNFKAAGDPFTEEFFVLFRSVYEQQFSMLRKLQDRKRKLDKKLLSLKVWKRVSNVLFVTAFVSVLIFSVVAAAIAAPPVVTALAGALSVPIGSVGRWCNSLWNNYEKELKGQRSLVSSMQVGTFVTVKDMDSIRVLVDKLEMDIQSLSQTANFALSEENAVKIVIDDIRNKLEVLAESIDTLSDRADKCSRDVRQARTVILQRILKYPDQ